MKKLILMLAVTAASYTAIASDENKNETIRFSELPFIEGKVYMAVSCGGESIHKAAAEVESDSVLFPIELSKWEGKEIEIEAFQDLNDNKTLDFDPYGRPAEPCIRTSVAVDLKQTLLDFQLIRY